MKPDELERAIAAGIRPAAKVKTIAAMLEVDSSIVRKLVKRGELRAFTLGKRGVRIFLDSVVAYQERQVCASQPEQREVIRQRKAATSAAHKAAVEYLMACGVISRPADTPTKAGKRRICREPR